MLVALLALGFVATAVGTPVVADRAAAAVATSSGPNPSSVSINSIVYGGTGCPQGSLGSYISSDRSTYVLQTTSLRVKLTDHVCMFKVSPSFSTITLRPLALASQLLRAERIANWMSTSSTHLVSSTVFSAQCTEDTLDLMLVSKDTKDLLITSPAVCINSLVLITSNQMSRNCSSIYLHYVQWSCFWRLRGCWWYSFGLRCLVALRLSCRPQHRLPGPSIYCVNHCYGPDYRWFGRWKDHFHCWSPVAEVLGYFFWAWSEVIRFFG